MIYTVTFNPSLDYVVQVKNFRTGILNRTEREWIYPGGKGVNVSLVLKNMGVDSIALGITAGFTGERISSLLQGMGCRTDFIHIERGLSRINVKIKSDVESEINGQGPEVTPEDIQMLYRKLDGLKAGDILVLAGSVPGGMPDTLYRHIAERMQAASVRTVVDATGKLLSDTLRYSPFLVKPNHEELGALFGETLQAPKDIIFYGRKLQEMGAKNVLVSMAGEGAVLLDEEGRVHVGEAPTGKVMNSVGAGDSMVAGFLSGYLKNSDYREAFKTGIAAGSASAFSAGLAEKKDVEILIPRVVVRDGQ